MTGTDLYPIKQDYYSGRLEMVYAAVIPKPGYHYEYNNEGIRAEVKDADSSIPVLHIGERTLHIVSGCAGTQYGCMVDGRTARTKEQFEKDRELTKLPIIVPEILKPIFEPENNTFEEILKAETEGIKTGIFKGIITGIAVGIILMKVL